MSLNVEFSMFELPQGVKDEVLLVPFGRNQTVDGNITFEFSAADAQGVAAFFKSRGIDFLFDYEHQSIAHLPGFENFKSPNGQAPAAAWAKEVAVGDKGLVARGIRWTPGAAAAVKDGSYRYHSPVLVIDPATNKVKAIQSAALTNEPRLKGSPALAARSDLGELLMSLTRKEHSMELSKELLAALGLKPDAGEQDALGAVNALKTKAAAGDAAAGQVTAFKSQAETAAGKASELETKVASLTADLTAAKAEGVKKDGEITAFKTQATDANKALADAVLAYGEETGRIAPAAKAAFKAQVDKDPAGMLTAFKAMAAGSAVPTGRITRDGKGDGGAAAGEAAPSDHLHAFKGKVKFDDARMKIHEAALAYQAAHRGVSYSDAVVAVTPAAG